jgi:hypothetical protein
MVQEAIFDWLVMQKYLAIRINSGAMAFDGKGSQARRFVRFVSWKILGQVLKSAGVSDILACCNGRFVAIEVKAPGKKGNLSQAQDIFLMAVRRCGGLAIVAESIDDVSEVLAGI